MNIDPDNPVVVLCAAGMAVGGDSSAALPLFEQAWLARRNDYDACIAAHFVARHQATPEETLHWNGLAVYHANRVADGSVIEFMASLYLCLGDALANLDRHTEALAAASAGRAHLAGVPNGGYRNFIENGISRLESRLAIDSIRTGHPTNVAADERSLKEVSLIASRVDSLALNLGVS